MQRILIVDDDEMVRTALRELLEEKGYHLADAESGPLALALFPLFKPDAVLLDILMPGMDGIEVLQRMKLYDLLAAFDPLPHQFQPAVDR